MAKKPTDGPVEVPKWDVALEALIKEEYKKLRRPLGLGDFRRLGKQHRIRLHDILETVLQLDLQGKWRHQGRDLPGGTLSGLYVHGRVDEDTAEKYSVTWAPRQ